MTALPLAERRTAVYRVFDDDDTLLYVGCSYDPRSRFHAHRGSPMWPAAAYTKLAWFPDRFTALLEEARAIVEEAPLHNKRRTPPEQINAPKTIVPPPMLGPYLDLERAAEAVRIPAHWLWRGLVTGKLPHSCAGDDSDDVWFTQDDVRDLHIIFDLPPLGLEHKRRSQRHSIYKACRLNRCTHAGI